MEAPSVGSGPGPDTDKSTAPPSSSLISVVSAFWEDFELEKERSILDEQGLRTAESQKNRCKLAEIPYSEDSTIGNPKQVSVKVDDSTITASEVDGDQNSTNFLKPADRVDYEGGSVTNFILETYLNNGTTQPVHPANAVENELNNVAAPSATCPKFGKEQEVVSAEFEFDPFGNIIPDPGARNVHKFKPKIKPGPRVGNTIASASSNAMMEKSVELPTSCTNNFQSSQSCGDASGELNKSTSLPLPLPTVEIPRTTDLPNKFGDTSSTIPFSEDTKSFAAAIPSLLDSLNAMHSEDAVDNGTRDWPSSFDKSSGEAAHIFSGLESLDDFLTQAATNTGKPAFHSFNENGGGETFVTSACGSINSFGECDTIQVQRCPEYHTPQDSLTFDEATDLNEDDTHTNNRRSETENASKRKSDGLVSCSLRKNRRFSVAAEEHKGGKTSRQLRKQAARKPANSSLNEDVEDSNDLDPPYNSNGDELQENEDDYEVNYPSKKNRKSASSQKNSVAKSGKTSQERKRANDDLQKTKEPPKKFSHSTRRRKRCVDKALLEIPQDELDLKNFAVKDIILLGEHWERLAKKESMTSNTSSTNQSGGDFLDEPGAYNEGEFSGSEDGRDPCDDQANEGITSTSPLFNYHSFREKVPRAKWSKQDTELFYEAVRMCCSDFSMINEYYFPHKTRHQIKLKYKKEEREHPSLLNDALCNPAKDYSSLIEQVKLKLASTKADKDPNRDASDFMMAEEVVDLTAGTNVTTTKEDADVKAQGDSVAAVHSPEQSDDDNDSDFQKWSQYKSFY